MGRCKGTKPYGSRSARNRRYFGIHFYGRGRRTLPSYRGHPKAFLQRGEVGSSHLVPPWFALGSAGRSWPPRSACSRTEYPRFDERRQNNNCGLCYIQARALRLLLPRSPETPVLPDDCATCYTSDLGSRMPNISITNSFRKASRSFRHRSSSALRRVPTLCYPNISGVSVDVESLRECMCSDLDLSILEQSWPC
jgi:hypothetical protein